MKIQVRNLIALSIILLQLSTVNAEIFKWSDEQGKVHFSDKKPAHLESSEVKLKINTIKSVWKYGAIGQHQ
ncbi:MAG: DUF4124 domain-containing protein [Candidatus Thiodiazotropha sp. LLP2]